MARKVRIVTRAIGSTAIAQYENEQVTVNAGTDDEVTIPATSIETIELIDTDD